MSTSNFERMNYNMPLISGGLASEDYFDEDELYFEFECASELAECFSEGLKYHNIMVKSGYYEGFQFQVYETCNGGDLDKNSPYCIDNDDARYYYDKCKSQVLREAEAEKKRIKKWLLSLKKYGYIELEVSARLSNGETWYSEVA